MGDDPLDRTIAESLQEAAAEAQRALEAETRLRRALVGMRVRARHDLPASAGALELDPHTPGGLVPGDWAAMVEAVGAAVRAGQELRIDSIRLRWQVIEVRFRPAASSRAVATIHLRFGGAVPLPYLEPAALLRALRAIVLLPTEPGDGANPRGDR